jgi:hypothetical protein
VPWCMATSTNGGSSGNRSVITPRRCAARSARSSTNTSRAGRSVTIGWPRRSNAAIASIGEPSSPCEYSPGRRTPRHRWRPGSGTTRSATMYWRISACFRLYADHAATPSPWEQPLLIPRPQTLAEKQCGTMSPLAPCKPPSATQTGARREFARPCRAARKDSAPLGVGDVPDGVAPPR